MISGQSLTCPKGASLTFEIDMETGSDLTGAAAQWALAESWFKGAKVFLTKTGAGDGLFINQDAGIWKIIVNLAPSDTLDVPSGLLYHDCKVLLQNGDVEDVANGPFVLNPSVNVVDTNAPITRNIRGTQNLGLVGQTATGTLSTLPRNLQAAQTLGGIGQTAALTGSTGGASPVFQTDFLSISSLPAQFSLSRATSGTRFNVSGVLVIEAVDTPRFDYVWNGSAWMARGLLIEEQRTNLLLQSENIPAAWSPEFATFGSGGTNPAGTTALLLTEGTGSSRYDFLQAVVLGSAIYTISPYLKSNGRRYVTASMGATTTRIAFDLNSGTITQNDANASGKVNSIGGGWYRLPTTSVAAVAIDYAVFGLSDTGTPAWDPYGRTVYTGDGTSGAYFYGLQLEVGAFATSYIPTTTTAGVTRSADILGANSPLSGYLAAGPSVWEFEDEATGTIARSAYAAGAFDWPVNKWYRSFGVYPTGTDTSSHMVPGTPY